MDEEEFVWWEAYWRVEPFGDDWRRAGRAALWAAGPHLKRGASLSEEDFLPLGRPRRQSPKEIEMRLGLYFAAHEAPKRN